MKSVLILFAMSGLLASAAGQVEEYAIPAEAVQQAGVPKGTIDGPHEFRSTIFPGTVRQYWVYVPAQYDARKPNCLMVVQDGFNKAKGWRLPTVLDNLIHSGAIPVQVGIFVTPGVVPAANKNAQPRFNRSFEYDAMGDRYARFLIDELLPEVRKSYTFSDDPNDRCIAGSSSGAICAFTAAWERPDAFRRVFSTVGTYVGLRGGNEYPTLVRKSEPRPIRIYLQDGSNDLDIYGGSWFNANLSMLSALQFAGYDVQHVWGEGGHNNKHGAAVIPEGLKWLWRSYPEPVTNVPGKPRRTDLLLKGQGWKTVSKGNGRKTACASGLNGEIFFADMEGANIRKMLPDGTVSLFAKDAGQAVGMSVASDGRLLVCNRKSRTVDRYNTDGQKELFLSGVDATDILVLPNGDGYLTEHDGKKVWRFRSDGSTEVVDEGIDTPSGLTVSPDQTTLTVGSTHGRFLYSFRIEPDGGLRHKQEYGWLHVNDHLISHAGGIATDREGRTYVASGMGIQVLDQPGRVHFIINSPAASPVTSIAFGGLNSDVLFVTCGSRVYSRKLNTTGVNSFAAPQKAPRPRL